MESMISTDPRHLNRLAANLRAVMDSREGCTQQWLERESGVSQGTISRILNAKHDPSVTVVLRLAQALKTSVDVLMGEPDGKKSAGRY
jgi:transcriptional regulator with XRE-family HTH domain